MEFQLEKLKAQPTIVVATQRLFRTNDGRLVGEGDPDAAFLFCAPGQAVPLADAQKYGLMESDSGGHDAKPESAPTEEGPGKKESRPSETKEIMPSETKRKKPVR